MEFTEQIDLLANEALEKHGEREHFSPQDLANATLILNRIVSNLQFDLLERDNVVFEDRIKQAEQYGTLIREILKVTTGVDLHEAVNGFQYGELNDPIIK